MSTPLADTIRRKTELTKERDELLESTSKRVSCIDAELKDLKGREAALILGIDMERIDRAKKIIYVQGRVLGVRHGMRPDENRNNVRGKAVEDAKHDLCNACPKMYGAYIGVKNYDSFGDQREDHNYGMAPRHGHIVFQIGLTKEARTNKVCGNEAEDALYFLSVLPEYERAVQ